MWALTPKLGELIVLVLVIEDDELMADLLSIIMEGLYVGVKVRKVTTLTEALLEWSRIEPDAVICDWNLPDGSGLDFVSEVRKSDGALPLVIVTARSDKASVIAAARYNISAFITKPFDIDMVSERFRQVIPPRESLNDDSVVEEPDFHEMLKRAKSEGVNLADTMPLTEIHDLRGCAATISISELQGVLEKYPSMHSRLIQMANRSLFRRGAEPVISLQGALQIIGVQVALDIALASAMDFGRGLQTPWLRERGEDIIQRAERVGKTALFLARETRCDDSGCLAAGMLYRAGELGVLTVAQRFICNGGTLDDRLLDEALTTYSKPIAARIKIQARLPLDLKAMIGATHGLPRGYTNRRLPLMRLATLMAEDQMDTPECRTLMRRLEVSGSPVSPED